MSHPSQVKLERSQVLWATMLAQKRHELVAAKADKVLTITSMASVQSSLMVLHTKDKSTRTTKVLARIDPVLARLRCMIAAISVFIQSDPTYSSLVWGGLLVCLECFSKSNEILAKVVGLFEKMSKAMPRFEQYMELYPNNSSLEQALLDIFGYFADACISAIKLYRRKPIYRPMTFVVSGVAERFDESTRRIEDSSVEFERDAKLSHDLAAAEHRKVMEGALSAVKLGTSQPLAPSKIFCVPFPRNHAFFGREYELKYILEKIQCAWDSQKSFVIHGIGGVGKTQLALEFAYKFRSEFRYIFWLTAEDQVSLSKSYGKIATLILIPTPPRTRDHIPIPIEVSRQWLCENKDWLLVFDNVEGEAGLLNQYWPPCQHGSILLTSQRTDLGMRTHSAFKLQPLSARDGSELLLRHLPAQNDEMSFRLAEEISKEVDGLPLLLIGLVGFISQSFTSLVDILRIFRESRASVGSIFANESSASAAFQYERPTQLVFRLSLDRLPVVARDVIHIMAMLSAENIPESLFLEQFEETLGMANPPPKAHAKSLTFAKEVRQSLGSRNLIEIRHKGSEVTYSMHRSLQRAILTMLDDDLEARQKTFDQAVRLIHRCIPRPSLIMVPSLGSFDVCETMIPHVVSIVHAYIGSDPPMKPSSALAEMICSACAYLYENGMSKLCLDTSSKGHQICEDLSQCHDVTLEWSSNISLTQSDPGNIATLQANIMAYGAGVLWMTGGITNRQQAQEMTWKVLEIRQRYIMDTPSEQLSIDEHVLLSNAYNDWALQLLNEGRYKEAKSFSEKSLTTKERLLTSGCQQFEFFISKIMIAYALLADRRSSLAVEMAEDAINHIKEEKGADNPYTQNYMFHVAIILANIGDFRQAARLFKSCMTARILLFGETNHESLNTYFAMSLCLFHLNDLKGAEQYIDQCFKHREAGRWSIECIIRANYLRALIMKRAGSTEDGERLESEALSDRNALLSKYGHEIWPASLPYTNEFIWFDKLVNIPAGRTTIAYLL